LDLIELEKEKENGASIALPRIKVNGEFQFLKTHHLIASFTHTLLINYTLSLIPTWVGFKKKVYNTPEGF